MSKVIVVTGASAGIGAALAELLAAQGHRVVLAARREAELSEVAARCGAQALPVVADLTNRADARRLAERALERFARVDVWVSNVGQGITRPPSELSDDDLDIMLRINVKTALYGIQAILPHFRGRGTGHLITISSILGRVPYAAHRSAYNGAKHFLNALIANLRAELAESDPGIRVSLVSPGVVRSEFRRRALHGPGPVPQVPVVQSAGEVAQVIATVIETGREDVYTRPGLREQVLRYYQELGQDP